MSHEITIYTTPSCSWCQATKEYLHAREIDFEEVDVSEDMRRAMEMVEKSGQQGVPVLDIDGEIIVGFDRSRIDALLGLN
ncbi:MAG: glutaredoxin family protein [Candidatus Thorarchaeota archaeon]|nr:glutathione S-transferase N-terminal domain-containing protein [Candidatus Bipolaricaulota bacterium]HHR85950.1 NrdH-redoxin [Candidatus Acetothermia bacterium]